MALGDGDGDGPCAARADTHLGQIQGLRDAYSHSGTRGGREAERGHLGCAGRRGRGWGAVATSPSPRRPRRHPPGAPTREQPALPSVPTRGPAGSVHCSPHAPLAAARKEPPSPAHRGKVQNWPRPLTHHLPHRESLSCPRPRRCAPKESALRLRDKLIQEKVPAPQTSACPSAPPGWPWGSSLATPPSQPSVCPPPQAMAPSPNGRRRPGTTGSTGLGTHLSRQQGQRQCACADGPTWHARTTRGRGGLPGVHPSS